MTFTLSTLITYFIMSVLIQAIENVKATAVGVTQANKVNAEKSRELQKPRPSSTLPADFFDNRETKRQKGGKFHLYFLRFLSIIPYWCHL